MPWEEVERLTPDELAERLRWAVQTDNRPAMYAYLQVIGLATTNAKARQLLYTASNKLHDGQPMAINKKAVAARTQANRLQAVAESRQQRADAERRMKEAGLVRWEQS